MFGFYPRKQIQAATLRSDGARLKSFNELSTSALYPTRFWNAFCGGVLHYYLDYR